MSARSIAKGGKRPEGSAADLMKRLCGGRASVVLFFRQDALTALAACLQIFCLMPSQIETKLSLRLRDRMPWPLCVIEPRVWRGFVARGDGGQFGRVCLFAQAEDRILCRSGACGNVDDRVWIRCADDVVC